jgi:hypothetical protein
METFAFLGSLNKSQNLLNAKIMQSQNDSVPSAWQHCMMWLNQFRLNKLGTILIWNSLRYWACANLKADQMDTTLLYTVQHYCRGYNFLYIKYERKKSLCYWANNVRINEAKFSVQWLWLRSSLIRCCVYCGDTDT